MRRDIRMLAAVCSAGVLVLGTPGLAVGQEDPSPNSDHAEEVATAAEGREDLDPSEEGLNDNNIDNDAGANWEPTDDPESEIRSGEMRSDSEEIPGGFTKEEADQAEVQEAEERASQGGIGVRAAPANCRTYWPSPFKVCGKIREKYDAMGGPASFLTWPRSDEKGVPDGVGRRNEFVNGFIYWHPKTGAHSITTAFSLAYERNGWESGRLGYPTSDEFVTPTGDGRKQEFENGAIYGSLSGLAAVEGKIYDKYVSMSASGGDLGYPIADEQAGRDGTGRYSTFTGGKMYWHPDHGAHPVTGGVLLVSEATAAETGTYGYPISDKGINDQQDIVQNFSKAELNLGDYLDTSDSINIAGKEINAKLVDLIGYLVEEGGISARQGPGDAVKPDPTVAPVPVPDYYVYDTSRGTLNDYCTMSYDKFYARDLNSPNVDFRGPCANHDMCYEAVHRGERTQSFCDNKFRDELYYSCDEALTGAQRRECRTTADVYYTAVHEVDHDFPEGAAA